MAFKTVTVRPSDGGQLLTRLEASPVPVEHYRIKKNFRRDNGRERRREGYVKFQPKEGAVGNQPYPEVLQGEQVTLIKSFASPAGRSATIAATKTKIYRFIALEDADVYYPSIPDFDLYSGSLYDYPTYYIEIPPDILTIPGHTAGDEDPAYYPIYSDSDDGGEWLLVGEGFSKLGHRWEAEEVAGTLILNNGYDLPVSIGVNEFSVTPLYELRDQGVAFVDSISTFNGMLMCIGVAEIQEDYLDAIRADSNYGPFLDSYKINRYQYRILNSPIGHPTRFGPNLLADANEGSTTVTLNYPTSFIQGGDEVIILGAGVLGGNLTSTVFSVSADRKILQLVDPIETTVAGAGIFRTDTLSMGPNPGFIDIEDDGSAALRGLEISNRFVILKANGVAVMSYTGNTDEPFAWRMSFRDPDGSRSLYYRWTTWVDRNGYIGYVGRYQVFAYSLTSEQVAAHPIIDQAADIIFEAAETAQEDEIFSAINATTDEVWICFPSLLSDKVLVYNMREPSCDTIDQFFTAAATITRPTESVIFGYPDEWFVMATPIPWPDGSDGDDLDGDLEILFVLDGVSYTVGNDGHIPFSEVIDTVDVAMVNRSDSTITFVSTLKDPLYGQDFSFSGDGLGASLAGGGSMSTILTISTTDAGVFSRIVITYTIDGGDPKVFYLHFGGPGSGIMRYAKSAKLDIAGSKAIYTRDGEEYDSILKGGFTDFGEELYEKMLRAYVPRVSIPSRAVDAEIKLFDADRASDDETLLVTKVIQASTIHTLFLAHNISDQITVSGTSDFELFARTFDIDVAQTRGVSKV